MAGSWNSYNEYKLTLGNKVINLSSDTLKVALFTSASNCGDVTLLNAWYGTLTGEVSNANGYTTGGVTVAQTWTGDHSVAAKVLAIANATWSATGAGIVARFAVLYDFTTSNKDLIAYAVLAFDSMGNPADAYAPSGNPFSVLASSVDTLA